MRQDTKIVKYDFAGGWNSRPESSELPEKTLHAMVILFSRLKIRGSCGRTFFVQNSNFDSKSSFEARKPIYSGRMTLIVSQIDWNSFPTDSENIGSIRQLLPIQNLKNRKISTSFLTNHYVIDPAFGAPTPRLSLVSIYVICHHK